MATQIITLEDLQDFRTQLLADLRQLLGKSTTSPSRKEWLKSSEVRKLLGISPGTLQQLRVSGKLRYTQVGSILFYKHQDIEQLLENNFSPTFKSSTR